MKRWLSFVLLSICLPAPAVAQAPAGPLLRTELESENAVPGQPIVLRVTVLAPTWLPKPPMFPSFEVPNVMVRLPERASNPASERVDGETWSGVSRAYRLYPMTVGRFRIPPRAVAVTFADPGTRKPVAVSLRTEALVFSGTAPEGAEGLVPFVAAESLTLEQRIDGDPADLEPGGAVTRTLTASLEGTSPMFLPPLIAPLAAEGFPAYPKEPVVTETEERGVLSGQRLESVTYVAEAGGRHTVPAVSLRWFNLRSGQIEVAQAPGFEIVSRGPPPSTPRTFDWRAAAPWVLAGALLAAVAAVVARKLWPRVVAWRIARREARLASEAHAYKRAVTALKACNFGGALRAIENWYSRTSAARQPGDARVSRALAVLGAAFYGRGRAPPAREHWSDAVRALEASRRERVAASKAARASSVLPPLNPG